MAEVHTFDLHIVIFPAEDVPGQWIGHCLELDVVSQGNSLRHAVPMIREAVEMVLVDDLSKKLDPMRRRAPQEDWDAMWSRLRQARPLALEEATRGEPEYVVLESVVTVTRLSVDELASIQAGTSAPPPVGFSVPVAFVPSQRVAL